VLVLDAWWDHLTEFCWQHLKRAEDTEDFIRGFYQKLVNSYVELYQNFFFKSSGRNLVCFCIPIIPLLKRMGQEDQVQGQAVLHSKTVSKQTKQHNTGTWEYKKKKSHTKKKMLLHQLLKGVLFSIVSFFFWTVANISKRQTVIWSLFSHRRPYSQNKAKKMAQSTYDSFWETETAATH
jgi:hypothetical protein